MGKIRKNVLGIVLQNGNVLVVKQNVSGDPNTLSYWGFPKGGVDNGESFEEALKREFKEELGVNNIKIIGKSKHKLSYSLPKELQEKTGFEGKESTIFFVTIQNEKIQLNEELSEYRWIQPESLYGFFTIQNQKELSKKLLPEIKMLSKKLAWLF